jgi:hypothetical protein
MNVKVFYDDGTSTVVPSFANIAMALSKAVVRLEWFDVYDEGTYNNDPAPKLMKILLIKEGDIRPGHPAWRLKMEGVE